MTSNHVDVRGAWAVAALLVGWGFIGAGLFAWVRSPESSIGPLMVATGFAWFVNLVTASNIPALFIGGAVLSSVYFVTAIHMLLAAPHGQGLGRGDRRIVIAGYLLTTLGSIPLALVFDPQTECADCPTNPWLIGENETFFNIWNTLLSLIGLVLIILVLRSLVLRWRRATRPERRLYAPVYAAGIALMIAVLAQLSLQTSGSEGRALDVAFIISVVPLALVPYLFVAAFVRTRMAQGGAVGELITRLGEAPRPGSLREAVADAVDDPSLELLFWLPEQGHYVDAQGHEAIPPDDDPSRVVTYVNRDGECIAALVHNAGLPGMSEHVQAVGAAAALALENERLDAALRAKLDELRSSRERMLRIGLEERRRLERDLHDGAQQRLVSMALNIRLARAKLNEDPLAADQLLASAGRELDSALEELRELARGIHPAVLTDRGLATALETLANRAPVPVELGELPDERLPEAVELAAYFVVAEALTNVAKYSEASHATVQGAARERPRGRGGGRRRHRRRRPRARHRPARARRPARGARGPARGGVGAGPRNHDHGEDPMRVVVADDSVLLREGVVRLLEEKGFDVVAQAGDAEDLIRKVNAHKPDVAIVDIRMPPTNTDDGLRAALEIRAALPECGVLVLSQYVEEGYALELVGDSAGGVGYLLKDRVADVDRFVDSVRRVAEGGSALDPEVVAQLVGRARRDDPLAELTPREREVLELMAEGRSNNAIATHMTVTERAVEKHVTSIFGKLGLPPAPEDHRRVLAVLAFLRA